MTDEPRMFCVEQSDHIIAQGPLLWGPDENGAAAVEVDGKEVVGIYVQPLADCTPDASPYQ